jgi:triosephosphate isomerase
MRRKLVAGNWKMHTTRASADALVRAIAATPVDGADVAVFPPYVYLAELIAQHRGSAVAIGAQDVSEHAQGAFTGEVAASMLRDIGATHVLVGHSERRQYHGESSARVALKFAQSQAAGLIPVLCVGETLEQRDAGATEAIVGEQLDAVVRHSGIGALAAAVVAYEPVWAIGTGRTALGSDAAAMAEEIRATLARLGWDASAGEVPILYGGSVTAANIGEFLAEPSIDGALVGGASLKPDEMAGIVARAGLTAAARGAAA